jgi:hemerythrin superfamily protein
MAAESGKSSATQAKALEPIESWREGAGKVETLAKEVAAALAADNLPQARRSFTEYREQVLAHLAREEDRLFPRRSSGRPPRAD